MTPAKPYLEAITANILLSSRISFARLKNYPSDKNLAAASGF